MIKRKLGHSGLSIAPLVLGGNVFGWNVDEQTGFRLLDAFVDHGFNAIDTADVYSNWAPGNLGGESESMIGRWLKARPGMRERVVIFTKVGSDMGGNGRKGLSRRWVLEAVEHSLHRLGTDVIDLYFAHQPDPETPQEETLSAFDGLLQAGKIRSIGASNFDADQMQAAFALAVDGLPRYTVLQPEYNLYDRSGFEGPMQELCVQQGIAAVTYFSLASGFLSGKYRNRADLSRSVRGEDVEKYLTPRGFALLDALQAVADRYDASLSEIALAWLMAQPAVAAPIASATKPEHVDSFARAAALQLTAEDLTQLAV
ncbi:aryl-alcohol dehydrogenase-like predicted oxidoreductase [Rhizobium pisi]|uniref:Aldo/keto reductase n=1 Tax=Rhizobium pisi TaxID=574561 RepID=A0A427MX84_9HYPH|nr:aldo/keto reductase [Rhizobium pisi]MBB3135896.1 aryl-alcohol dehydrogenase-like predicted oxidoreductase [Rhizobium pisi]RSB75770.1 aldo/keto reductase [Rhizobium pisi]TCA49387.1 aldo/keto reductase [Rhizobium pisi]